MSNRFVTNRFVSHETAFRSTQTDLPNLTYNYSLMKTKPKILFVCSRNQLRSPTAERIFQNHPDIEARSAGLSQKSPHTLSSRDIEWADAILVMETKHRSRILDMLRGKTFPPIEVLNIPDEYSFMDEELIEIIYVSTSEFVKNEFGIILG